jgi:hypothetical protein
MIAEGCSLRNPSDIAGCQTELNVSPWHLCDVSAGRDRAKAQGVRFGRPPSLTPHQRREAMERPGPLLRHLAVDH